MKNDYSVNAIVRAFSLLEIFSLKRNELTISEIKAETGMPISTIHRLLGTMERIGYIRQNPENGKYRLGLKSFILGSRVKMTAEIQSVADPIMKKLSEKYNETVHLATELDGAVLCLKKVEASHHISVTPDAGGAASLYCTSVGKCLMAFAGEARRRDLLNTIELTKFTSHTITEKAELIRQLAVIREAGYAMDNQELEIGLTCIGAPVFDHSGKCIAAVSISMLLTRCCNRMDDMIVDVKAAAQEITSKMKG
jgi:DNA-binding IclR family transcriptional regulator